jgi:hypothetical protein
MIKKLAAASWRGYILIMSRISHFLPSAPAKGSRTSQQLEMDAQERAQYLAGLDGAIAELDAGLYVSGEEMEAWAKSLFTPDELPLPPVRQRHRS